MFYLCILTITSRMKRIIFFSLLSSLFINSSAFSQQATTLRFQEDIHDFGFVDQEGGPVEYSFQFINITNRPIKILNVQPSCGCTTPDWTKEPVPAGATGFIMASFNPKGRPGYFNKSLTVTTDFDATPVILQIKGQVSVDSESGGASDLKAINGSWRLKTSSFNLGKIYLKDEFAAKEFPVFNGGDKPITYSDVVSPSYIRAEVLPKTILPGEEGKIRISYNGKEKGQYGFQSDHIEIHTDDMVQPVKSFSVYATLEDFFPVMTPQQLSTAPRLHVTSKSFDFGKLKQNISKTQEISVVNTGKTELTINAVQGNCACISAIPGNDKLMPGESSTIKIIFNPQDRLGTQQKSVTVYTNDPQTPVQRITFTAYVEE